MTLLTQIRATDRHELGDAVRSIAWSPTDRLLALGADGRALMSPAGSLSAPIGSDPVSCAWITVGRVAVADSLSGVVVAGGGSVDVVPVVGAVGVHAPAATGGGLPHERCAIAVGSAGTTVVPAGRSSSPAKLIDTGPTRSAAHLGGSIWMVGGADGLLVIDVSLACVDQRIELPGIVDVVASVSAGRIAASDCTGALHVLDIARLDHGVELTGYPDAVRHLGIDPGGHFVVACADDEVSWWGIDERGTVTDQPDCSVGHGAPITTCAVGPTGLVATGDDDGMIRLWTPHLRDVPVSAFEVDGEITSLAWSTWGDRLACGTAFGDVIVTEVVAGDVL